MRYAIELGKDLRGNGAVRAEDKVMKLAAEEVLGD